MPSTRRLFALGLVLGSLSLGLGCTGAIDDLLTYEETVDQSITVPGRGVMVNNPLAPEEVFPIDFGDIMAQQLNQSFETQDINKAAVSSMKVTAMSVEVTNPDEAGGGRIVNSLEFLESLSFTLSSEGVDPVSVAASAEGAFDVENIILYDFPVTENELVDVLKGGDELTMATDLQTEMMPDDRPLTNADLEFKVTIKVIADPAGAVAGGGV